MADGWTIGIIGGSGLYDIGALEDRQWIRINSPWGEASDEVLCGRIGDVQLRFLPRHGRGHRIAPSDLNARANIDVLKRAGCTDVLAISAVGSLREELEPGRFVVVDQFIDRTKSRPSSFFGTGMVAHVSMAEPVCQRLSAMAGAAVENAGGAVAQGGTYLAMEGPQFSTRAESHLYRQWGADVIGMTAMPEAKLCREAELPYALVGMVTDYDCWREDAAFVEVSGVIEQMQANGSVARKAVEQFIAALPETREPSPLDTVLDHALITAPEARDPAITAKLDAVAGRVL
ncbi:S-methyl-5'-thioadenosine phosphorylase [Alteriqipengyuania flavescens]|uniref:S-methyl-5'-thioadenosine phosphorylase n=1 Tax=Alteriqipengyuania flavescens TaxID=3053610 RepID=UPI0025B2F964|nr:S-methyl-5'-thioadenosine phosphorylase [Alteriqipengyuania flavescens]WJY20060.1 S-methyl-5'-thioadenosine phosphorylase [Alteriqipengyuania flavescens]WJY26002.1 S-methyl-5'-thioadenosine phosphorylase [Alteriqipengyuania flavescens]